MPPVTLFFLGAAVGCYGTIIGAGGGFLLVPLLLLLYPSESPATLTSLSLAVVALNALSGTTAYARKRRIDYRLGLMLSAAAVPGTTVGAMLTQFVPRGLFDAAFGAILLLLALFLFWKSAGQGSREPGETGCHAASATASGRVGIGVAVSGVVGWLSGIMGIGGSPLQVVVLTHLMRVPVQTAMPTAQFMVLLSALGGVGAHLVSGHFGADHGRLVWLGVAALLGAQMGAALSERITSAALVRLLALALLTVSLRLILKAI